MVSHSYRYESVFLITYLTYTILALLTFHHFSPVRVRLVRAPARRRIRLSARQGTPLGAGFLPPDVQDAWSASSSGTTITHHFLFPTCRSIPHLDTFVNCIIPARAHAPVDA
ncbi:hypothetical protein EVAR_63160_1 [Eumeta japonica]|uniref:Uncharacterized protein n=1 Tax=Eumeta variegata TaxID=151549 RepID=A0A4C1Z3E4_EUMVA|nr:hypothetical protein EVAR_63160_1 [Eumeta japonica]